MYALAADDNGVYVGGDFANYNCVSTTRLCRLDNNGTKVSTFAVGTGPNAMVNALGLFGTDLMVGGDFTTYKGNARGRILRLSNLDHGTGVHVGNRV